MKEILKTTISERIDGRTMPMLDVSVDPDSPGSKVMYSDNFLAKRLGLPELEIDAPTGTFMEEDGEDFVRNLWRHFSGNTYIVCDLPARVMEGVAPSRPKRNAPRGEPKMDPLEDIEGQYRRFQQRDQEL